MIQTDTKPQRRIQDDWFDIAPGIFAALSFAAGFVAILAVAAPSLPHMRGLDAVERLFAEFPEFSASVGGVALMGLATGLLRRIDSAWAAATALFSAGCLYAFFRHDHLPFAIVGGAIAVGLWLSRRAFYRHSRLTQLAPGPQLALAIAGALAVGVIGALLWAGGRPGFAEAPWWALLTDPHLGRPGRSLTIGLAAFGGLMANRYFLERAKGAPAPAGDEALARVEQIIAATPDAPPDAQLAFCGDKSFIFAEDAFVMSAKGGSSLISMLGPVGKRAYWRPALIAFREEAARLLLRPVVYAAPPDLLPELIDLGFRVEKVGENALIDLPAFSLKGSAKQNLRTARRRLVEREGAVFEVSAPPLDEPIWRELEEVSNAWLEAHGGREKAFSLGAFDRAYLRRHPIAIVRQNGIITAFANVWVNAGGTRAAVDLMRFHPEKASKGVMDFLLSEMLIWARDEGMQIFDLGMAPLTGLSETEFASFFARIGRLVAQYGDSFYSFEGLRTFKDKFDPRWEPRYISAPGAWTLPIVLAEVGFLSNGPKK
jgi:lysylphosphatidylglycerol synthetase-like protein (DUF2156 family)